MIFEQLKAFFPYLDYEIALAAITVFCATLIGLLLGLILLAV